jgi:signal transduction histidine kinase
LAPEARSLSLGAQVIGLRSPEKTRVRYRLRGFESKWTQSEGRAVATYTNMPPGEFGFEVSGRNGLGVWSEAREVAVVTVLPAWWQRWEWQLAIVLLALLGSAWLGRLWVLRRFRRRLEQAEREQALTRERERIARDIHDILGANLARLRHLGARVGARTEDAADDLKRVESLCDESLDNLRELVWTTDPKCDTVASTVDFLEQQIGEVARECGLRVKFEISPDLPNLVLDAARRHGLLLLVRESLTNVLKHARASLLTFRCRWEQPRLHIDVLDDGRGFDPTSTSGDGHGLGNLTARAESLGATYVVQSVRDGGTTVAITLPVGV